MQRAGILLGLCGLLCALLSADVLTLTNGKVVNGTFLGGDARNVRMEVNNKIESFRISDVASIRFGDAPAEAAAKKGADKPAGAAAATATGSQSSTSGWGTEPDSTARTGAQPATRPATPVKPSSSEPTLAERTATRALANTDGLIPKGTLLQVRMIDSIDSSVHQPGETFRASLETAVLVGERTVIPKGTDVTLRLMEAQQSGRVQGKALLKVEAVSVRVDGRSHPVFTEAAVTEGDSRTTESAKVIGGTAAVGAIIGAIAGGGKGAAIGAAAGAGAGTGVQVLRGSDSIKVPTEALLAFRTTQDVRIP